MRRDSEEYLKHLDFSIKEIGRGGFQEEITQGFMGAGNQLCYHTHNSQHSPPGYPDTVVVIERTLGPLGNNPLVVIEAKVRDNKPSPEQLAWLNGYRRTGAYTFCLWPRHRPVLHDLYEGRLNTDRVFERIHKYTKR